MSVMLKVVSSQGEKNGVIYGVKGCAEVKEETC